VRRFAPLLAFLASGCISLEPHYVRPQSAVPASWPVGDSYLAQSEAGLPAVTYKDIFRDSRLQALIQQADQVIVMQGGRIVECGTPEGLMRNGGYLAAHRKGYIDLSSVSVDEAVLA